MFRITLFHCLLILPLFMLLVSCSNDPRNVHEDLPEQFRGIPALHDGLMMGEYICRAVPSYPKGDIAIVAFDRPDSTIILKSSNFSSRTLENPEVYIETYLKYDHEGRLIDSLVTKEMILKKLANDYLVNGRVFSTWPMDGDTAWHPCEELNLADTMSKEALHALAVDLHDRSEMAFSASVYVDDRSENAAFFLIGDTFTTLYHAEYMYSSYDQPGLHPKNPPRYTDSGHWRDRATTIWKGENDRLRLLHFHKQRYHPAHTNGPFAPAPMSFPAKYDGQGYLQLDLPGGSMEFSLPMVSYKDTPFRKEGRNRQPFVFLSGSYADCAFILVHPGQMFVIERRSE